MHVCICPRDKPVINTSCKAHDPPLRVVERNARLDPAPLAFSSRDLRCNAKWPEKAELMFCPECKTGDLIYQGAAWERCMCGKTQHVIV